MSKTLRCRINEKFSSDLMKALNRICTDKTIPDNNSKIDMVLELLKRYNVDFSTLGPGTNRYAILIDGIVFKIALDKWGQRDNLNEFVMSKELQPYVIKVYEVNSNGLIMTCQYVTVIDKDEYAKQREGILSILDDLSQSYLLGDVGYVSKNYLNWGYTDEGELVILDFAYIYKVVAYELMCTAPNCTHPYLEYTESYNSLVCPDCGKKYTFSDIRRRYNKSDEDKYVRMAKEISYKTQDNKLIVEDSLDKDLKEYEKEFIDEEPEEVDYSKVTYNSIKEDSSITNFKLEEINERYLLDESYYRVIDNPNVFDYETVQTFKEERTMSEFMKQMSKLYQESAKRNHQSANDNPYISHDTEKVDRTYADIYDGEVKEEEVDYSEEASDAYDMLLKEYAQGTGARLSEPVKVPPIKPVQQNTNNKPAQNQKKNFQKPNNNPSKRYDKDFYQKKVEQVKPKSVVDRTPVSVPTVPIKVEEPVKQETPIRREIPVTTGNVQINIGENLNPAENKEELRIEIPTPSNTEEKVEEIVPMNDSDKEELLQALIGGHEITGEPEEAEEEIEEEVEMNEDVDEVAHDIVSPENPSAVIHQKKNVDYNFIPAEEVSSDNDISRLINERQKRMR